MKSMSILLVLIVCGTVAMAGTIVWPTVKYGQQVTIEFGVRDSNSPWRSYQTAIPADDVYVSKDGGTPARATNSVSIVGHHRRLVLTATEMQAAVVTVDVNDETSPKAYGDETIIVPTHGNSSALNEFDLDQATPTVNVTKIDSNEAAVDHIVQWYATDWLTVYNDDANLPRVDVNLSGGATPLSTADIEAEVTDALEAEIGTPTEGSIAWLIEQYLTGNAFTRLGAPAGASIAADIADVNSAAGDVWNTLLSGESQTPAQLLKQAATKR